MKRLMGTRCDPSNLAFVRFLVIAITTQSEYLTNFLALLLRST